MKKLDRYVLSQFAILLTMTFFIVLFVLVMQFIWLRADDIIGKGIPIMVMAKFFFYISLASLPVALPLAILLSSLMVFGNLGERLELIAMKTAGISLFRIMRPLIVLIASMSIGAFFYSNYVLPIAQKRMWTLVFSFKDKSLELEIPVGEFYAGIKGKNIYARGKDTKTKALTDVMIYDFANGFDNASITAADTVRISTTTDHKYIKILMLNGECFENVRSQQAGSKTIPYRRETFLSKEILFEFDTGFKEFDETFMSNTQISKNVERLTRDIDSINRIRDSLHHTYAKQLIYKHNYISQSDSTYLSSTIIENTKNIDSLFLSSSHEQMANIVGDAKLNIDGALSDIKFKAMRINEANNFYTAHNLERHIKFTLSFACIIFFFIGAPLGAIIGKGGLGLPAVVSIVLFVFYYIINTMGQKLGREGDWEVWQGAWLASSILLPLSMLLTYRAVKDSRLFEGIMYVRIYENIKKKVSKIFPTKK